MYPLTELCCPNCPTLSDSHSKSVGDISVSLFIQIVLNSLTMTASKDKMEESWSRRDIFVGEITQPFNRPHQSLHSALLFPSHLVGHNSNEMAPFRGSHPCALAVSVCICQQSSRDWAQLIAKVTNRPPLCIKGESHFPLVETLNWKIASGSNKVASLQIQDYCSWRGIIAWS